MHQLRLQDMGIVNVAPFSSLASISNTCQRFVCSNIASNDFTYRIDLMITDVPVGSILFASSTDAILFG